MLSLCHHDVYTPYVYTPYVYMHIHIEGHLIIQYGYYLSIL